MKGREGKRGEGKKGKEPSSFVKRLMNISSQRKASSSQNTVIIILMLCEVIPFSILSVENHELAIGGNGKISLQDDIQKISYFGEYFPGQPEIGREYMTGRIILIK